MLSSSFPAPTSVVSGVTFPPTGAKLLAFPPLPVVVTRRAAALSDSDCDSLRTSASAARSGLSLSESVSSSWGLATSALLTPSSPPPAPEVPPPFVAAEAAAADRSNHRFLRKSDVRLVWTSVPGVDRVLFGTDTTDPDPSGVLLLLSSSSFWRSSLARRSRSFRRRCHISFSRRGDAPFCRRPGLADPLTMMADLRSAAAMSSASAESFTLVPPPSLADALRMAPPLPPPPLLVLTTGVWTHINGEINGVDAKLPPFGVGMPTTLDAVVVSALQSNLLAHILTLPPPLPWAPPTGVLALG